MNINDYNNVTDRIEPSARCREEVLNMNKRRKNTIKLSRRGLAFIVAAAVAACGGTAVFAAEKLGAFDKLKDVRSRTIQSDDGREFPINKEERKDYEKIGSAAEILSEPVSADTENISLNIDSVYCDGRTIILGITGSLADGNPNGWGYIHLMPILSINGREYLYPNSIIESDGYMVIDEGADNSFTGSITFVLKETEKLSDPVEITVNMPSIQGSKHYFTEQTFIDSVSLTTEVTPETELARNYGTFFEEDGYSFTVYEISPAMMVADFSYPKEYDRTDETTMTDIVYNYDGTISSGRPKYGIIAMIYDENGNRLERVLDQPIDIGGDKMAETYASPDTDKIIVKFCNKQEAGEDGMPVVMKEMTIDLTEIKNAE